MRLLVCGGRDFVNVPQLWRVLDKLRARTLPSISLVIDGASDDVTGPYQGADYWAHQWAIAHGIPTVRVHAEWKQHGKAAGPIRNKDMIDFHRPTYVVAFPGGRGTEDMVTQAKKAGLQVLRLAYEPLKQYAHEEDER